MDTFCRAVDIAKKEGVPVLIKKSLKFFRYALNKNLYKIFLPYMIYNIRKSKFEDIHDTVDFSFNWMFGIIRPMQIRYEILELLKILKKRKIRTVLEIGTANGGTLFLFTHVVASDATIISVDLPEGMFGGGYPKWKIHLYNSFAISNQKIYLIRANSHEETTLNKVKNILGDHKLDFLFIDGDHTYSGVKKDYEMYAPLVKRGGIIAFHDIVPGPEVNVGGVPRFWSEIKHNYRFKEIVRSWDQGGYGIGVLFID